MDYPIVITYTTYHCKICRAVVKAICKAHPTAAVISVENYTDGRAPTNPWNSKNTVFAASLERAVETNGNTVHRIEQVAKEPIKAVQPITKEDKEALNTENPMPKRGRGRPKGSKNKSK